jgi:hypothetical protein
MTTAMEWPYRVWAETTAPDGRTARISRDAEGVNGVEQAMLSAVLQYHSPESFLGCVIRARTPDGLTLTRVLEMRDGSYVMEHCWP